MARNKHPEQTVVPRPVGEGLPHQVSAVGGGADAYVAARLHAQAMTWEIRHAGRTPRVARQFVASLSV